MKNSTLPVKKIKIFLKKMNLSRISDVLLSETVLRSFR